MNCLHEKGGITEPAVHCLDGTGARKHVLFPAQPSTLPAFIPVLHTCQHALDAFIHTHTHPHAHTHTHTHTHTQTYTYTHIQTCTHTHTQTCTHTHTHTHTHKHAPH